MPSFKFKKKYGQNFLNDNNIIDKIVNSIKPSESDLIVEIGPGAGALTKNLVKYNAQILAFEIDNDTKKYLDSLSNDKCHIIYEDFLEADILGHLKKYNYEKLFIIGNLPYYITTAILERIIDLKINAESITIMVQKEVADRFLAQPHSKEYGYMTVLLNFFYSIHKIVDVKRTSFYPQPNVDSSVVKLDKKQSPIVSYEIFKGLIKESFQFKRKKLINNITTLDKSQVLSILSKHGFSSEARAEELDLETFVELAQKKEKKNA